MNRRAFVTGAVGLVIVPRAAARRLGGSPVALVTADLESHVAAVLLGSGEVIRRIPTLPGPRSIESLRQTIGVVAHTTEGALTLIEGPSLRVVRVVRGFGEPRYTAIAHHAQLGYVTDSARGEVVTVDLHDGRIIRRLEVGGPARHVSLHPSGRILWAALGTKADEIAVVDVREERYPRLLARVAPPFRAHDVVFAPGGRNVWVTSGDRRSVAVYDVKSRRLLRVLDADRPPQHVTFTRGAAYVTSGDEGLLRIHSLRGDVRHTARVPLGSYNVQEAWDVVLTPSLSEGTLSILGRDGRLRQRVDVARSSHDTCLVVSA